MRVGVYSDLAYRSDGSVLSTHQAFIRFVTSLPPRVDEVVLFGRLHPEPARSHYVIPSDGVRFVALPHYPAVTALAAQARAARGTVRQFVRELPELDAVWIFGPHPMAVLLALAARRNKTPLFLGVRQDYPSYIANRLPSRRWAPAVAVAKGLERTFRLLARRAPTIAVGEELAGRYAGGEAPVLAANFSLVSGADIVSEEDMRAKPWEGELRLLTVGRVDVEKNPLLLPEVLARLNAREHRWRLSVAGDGPLLPALERRLDELGVAASAELHGYVANGPELWRLYRRSHAFLHVSLTEGLPQVLAEAQAAGLPIVATDVGSVRKAVADGQAGLLIPPGDPSAAVEALERLAEDQELRVRLSSAALELVKQQTMEAQLDRVAAFLYENLP